MLSTPGVRPRFSGFFALSITAALVVLSGCSLPGPGGAPSTQLPSTPTNSTAAGPDSPLSRVNLRLERIAKGLDEPLFATHAGDGSERIFIVEQTGRVRVIRDGRLKPTPFLDLSKRVSTGGERGLLGLAFAPDYAETGRFYVNFTDPSGATTVARFTADDPASDTPRLSSPEVLLRVAQPYANHNGGCIAFAPDGTLWIGMGDGGSAGDPEDRAQDSKSLLGKMLVLDVDSANPRPRVLMSGLRNPWRYSFDRKTGDVWIGDVGQGEWEEIDRLLAEQIDGANLGWRRWEGSHAYPEGSNPSRDGFTFPIAEYSHAEGQSITGGYVYRGEAYPALDGIYLYADYVAGWIGGLRVPDGDAASDGDVETRVLLRDAGNPSSFGEDEEGELYLVDYGGSVYRVTATLK